ncbi:hypothetical protein R3F64_01535 [Halomonas sp. 5021]|uniref:hypothetical protein n=1 Tax=Halomonas sp. 5021 TaxID=3082156 RepID=UPI002FC5D5A7
MMIGGEITIAQQKRRIADLEAQVEQHKAAEEMQIALRQKADEREAALAAHVERLKEVERDEPCYGQIVMEVLDYLPDTSLARRDKIKQAEMIEALALKAEVSDITAEACYDDHSGSPLVFERDVSEAVADWLRRQSEQC